MEIKSVTILQETDQAGLFISGSAAGRNVLYTCEELERQEKNKCCRFSVYDNHEDAESKDIEEGRGFRCRTVSGCCMCDRYRGNSSEKCRWVRINRDRTEVKQVLFP